MAAPLTSLLGRSATAACVNRSADISGRATQENPRHRRLSAGRSRSLFNMHPSPFQESTVASGPHIVIPIWKMSGKLVIALFSGGKCSKLSSLLRLFDSQLKKGSDGLLRRSAAAVVVDVAGLRVVARRGEKKSPKQPRCFIIAALKLLGCQVDCFDCLFFLAPVNRHPSSKMVASRLLTATKNKPQNQRHRVDGVMQSIHFPSHLSVIYPSCPGAKAGLHPGPVGAAQRRATQRDKKKA